MSSEIWDGKNCCLCSVNSSADRASCWSSCCSCSLPHKRISLPGKPFEYDIIVDNSGICNDDVNLPVHICVIMLSDNFHAAFLFLIGFSSFYDYTDLS